MDSTQLKHTAAPWSVHWHMAQGGDGHWIMDSSDHCELSRIAMVAFHDDAAGETRANATLISAAPELLAALIACRGELAKSAEWSAVSYAVKMADQAIAKAVQS